MSKLLIALVRSARNLSGIATQDNPEQRIAKRLKLCRCVRGRYMEFDPERGKAEHCSAQAQGVRQ